MSPHLSQDDRIHSVFDNCFSPSAAQLARVHCRAYQKYVLPYHPRFHSHNPRFFSSYPDDKILLYKVSSSRYLATDPSPDDQAPDRYLSPPAHHIPTLWETRQIGRASWQERWES